MDAQNKVLNYFKKPVDEELLNAINKININPEIKNKLKVHKKKNNKNIFIKQDNKNNKTNKTNKNNK